MMNSVQQARLEFKMTIGRLAARLGRLYSDFTPFTLRAESDGNGWVKIFGIGPDGRPIPGLKPLLFKKQ